MGLILGQAGSDRTCALASQLELTGEKLVHFLMHFTCVAQHRRAKSTERVVQRSNHTIDVFSVPCWLQLENGSNTTPGRHFYCLPYAMCEKMAQLPPGPLSKSCTSSGKR